MTLDEILNALENLKDYTNDYGKVQLEGIKSAVRDLVDVPAGE